MLQYGKEKPDYTSLITYLQLNYIPAPDTIFQQVKKTFTRTLFKNRRQAHDHREVALTSTNPLIPHTGIRRTYGPWWLTKALYIPSEQFIHYFKNPLKSGAPTSIAINCLIKCPFRIL